MGRKIGILTHHYINNFGAFLQAYALAETVRKCFPDDEVWIINKLNLRHYLINTAGWFSFYYKRETFKMWREKIKLPHSFAAARKKYLKMTPLSIRTKGINNADFDCIIVGSDEVWNYMDPKANAKVKFGIGFRCRKLIAYAPSAGKTSAGTPIPEYVREGISRFDCLSARDANTAKLVGKITNKECTVVLDPTFLVKFPKARRKVPEDKYILFYYCEDLPEEIIQKIKAYAKKNCFRLYGAGECSDLFDRITVDLTPFEWIEMFRNAEYVFTGTFHGAVFSILNKKQFACYLTNKSRIIKVNDLLNFLTIGDRTLTSGMEVLKNTIDYDKVYKVIDEKKKISLDHLINSIGKE